MRPRFLAAVVSTLLLATACDEVGAQVPTDATQVEDTVTKTSSGNEKSLVWPKSCPVTVLGDDAFAPSSEEPEGPAEMYDAVWYGTPELYTMINPDGKTSENRWLGGEKTFWWSETFSISDEPEPDIDVTAQRLDGKTIYEARQTTHGMRDDIGDFMLVGVTLPEPGCWELTATYAGVSLSYVIWVEPKQ